MQKLIECVPNFSEGRNMAIIKQITDEIERVEGVKLLDVDPGKATNRTVVTFVGTPESVGDAAFVAIKKAAELIDMSKHKGEHPRFGATDVCPFVPVAGVTMQECVEVAQKLGERVGKELQIPVYLYENAATSEQRRNLAVVRAGEYEGIAKKITQAEWQPDFGEAKFNAKTGNVAIGARDFLIAYNVNLNTTSVRRANSVAFDIREQGRIKRSGNPVTGSIVTNAKGEAERVQGTCKGVKAIGWFIEEFGVAQVSMNITNINDTSLHKAFDESYKSAFKRNMRVTGSELVGLVPLKCILDAGRYFLEKQERSVGVSEAELIKIAVKSMGLDELYPFDPEKKIIEYILKADESAPLVKMSLTEFANETASESPAPGGGSVSAYLGALAAALGTMVANLSSHKRGWDDRWQEFSTWADQGQKIKDRLNALVDEDTRSFQRIMDAIRLPKGNEQEVAERNAAIEDATKYAMEVPFSVMEASYSCFELLKAMAESGNPNSASDVGVGALCARSAVIGAYLNVKINAAGLNDQEFANNLIAKGQQLVEEAVQAEAAILNAVEDLITAN